MKIPTVEEIVQKETEAGNIVQEEAVAAEKIAAVSNGTSEVKKETGSKEELVVQEEKSPAETAEGLENEPAVEAVESEVVQEALAEGAFVRKPDLELDEEVALLEAVFFLESEPQTVESLIKITQLEEDIVRECLERLHEKYANEDSGLELSKIIGGWMLTPKKDCFDKVKERYGKRNEGRLSKAAIETLAIIAYSQPITRAEIESIRHVNVDNMMRVLLERNFIKEDGKRKDIPGKPTQYKTTDEFLEFFHLQSLADLPQLDEKESERFELGRT